MYLMIQNPGLCDYEALTTLGLSTSRNSTNTDLIGQFGSGSKQAICLLLRKQISPIIFLGNLRMEFATRQISVNTLDGQSEHQKVIVKLSGRTQDGKTINRTEDTGFVLDFGALDWTEEHMAVREFVANAIDASLKVQQNVNGVKIEMVMDENRVRAKANTTRVFLKSNDQISNFAQTLKQRFLHFNPNYRNQPLLQKANRNLIKDNHGPVFFKQGVRVGERPAKPSLFDYNCSEFYLDESRNIQFSEASCKVARLLASSDANVLTTMFKSLVEDESYFEHELNRYYLDTYASVDEYRIKWQAAWQRAFGDNAILCHDAIDEDIIRNKGYPPVILNSRDWTEAAKSYGIPDVSTILTDDEANGRTVLEPTQEAQEALDHVWNLIEKVGMTYNKTKPNIKCFEQQTRAGKDTLGFHYLKTDTIFLHVDFADGNNLKTREVVLEETAHYITSASDFSRDFQNFLVKLALKSSELILNS